ncbi:hypothetical protein AALP_AA3G188100 [Arabis alpina]|uniref:Ubiquitin-like protease family profile domain-containing protein n=1 Tax=Arabis alpina TaxID=50452 RepID=A0A087HA52_ARAAL|nr:hypothetical protein AALP_AA3G188100 [Arabis alpina]
MGAVAINRKRSEQSPNPFRHSPSIQASKKRRVSINMSEDSIKPSSSSTNSTISRISRYPDAKAPLKREPHAPSRGTFRFGSSKPKRNEKEKTFVRNYDFALRSAFGVFRDVRKVKDFVDLGDEIEKDDSSVEVVDDEEEKNVQPCSSSGVRKVKDFVDLGDEIEKEEISDDSSVEVVECDDVEEEKNVHQPTSSSGVTEDVKNGNDLRVVDDTGVMLDSLCLDREENDASSLEAYKKLMQSAERRNSKLEALGFQIVYNEKRMANLRQSRPKPVEKTKQVPHEPFIPLTEEDKAEVYRALSRGNRRKVLATHESSNIDISGEVLQCLQPSAWLNDEVINVYLELLKERETREPEKYLKCHFFNTFFYKKLVSDSGYNYKAVRRWTTQRKLGYALIDCDMIFIPVHRGVHWTLAVINNRDQKFLYLDSLNGVDPVILNALAKYLVDEVKEKSGKNIDVSSWDMEFLEDLPQQQNGYDCGMFMLKYIDFFSRGLGLCFSQEHMPYFRLRTAKEILRLRAD